MAFTGLPEFAILESNTVDVSSAAIKWTAPYQTTNYIEYVGAEVHPAIIKNHITNFNEEKKVCRETLLMGFSKPLKRYFDGMPEQDRSFACSNFIQQAGLSDQEFDYISSGSDGCFYGEFNIRH